jgi:hypothetical protein
MGSLHSINRTALEATDELTAAQRGPPKMPPRMETFDEKLYRKVRIRMLVLFVNLSSGSAYLLLTIQF